MTEQKKHYRRCETCKKSPCEAIKEASKTIDNKVISEMILALLRDFTGIVGCAGHRSYDTDPLGINDHNSPAYIAAKQYSDECHAKFQRENPCPKCGSHNTDIDWGTPRFCRDCGHEW